MAGFTSREIAEPLSEAARHTSRAHRAGLTNIIVQPDGNKGIILAANTNKAWTSTDTDEVTAMIRQAPANSIIIVADLEVSIDIVRQRLITARQQGLRTVLDPSPARQMASKIYSFPDPAEAEQLIKLSDGSCVVVSRDLQEHLPTPRIHVVDKTGAGDAFAGALAIAFLQGKTSNEAARFAVAAAAMAVTRYGSQASYPIQVPPKLSSSNY